jgi:RNA polymerase sigma-70 factor, ECF subfamily
VKLTERFAGRILSPLAPHADALFLSQEHKAMFSISAHRRECLCEAGPACSTPDAAGEKGTIGIEHIDRLCGYALVLTRNRAHAEDLVQETYVCALEAVNRLRKDSNVKSWLFTILRNLWLNELRRHRSAPSVVELDPDSVAAEDLGGSASDAHQILMSKQNVDMMRSAIDQLPADYREVILLREFEELSYGEIAKVLRCPAGTVMSRLGRARARLRRLLASRWNTCPPSTMRHAS